MAQEQRVSPRFEERQLVLVMVDLARFTHAIAGRDSITMAELLDRFYDVSFTEISQRGGRVVKWMGDSCLATFEGGRGEDAVDCVLALEPRVVEIGRDFDVPLGTGSNVHQATVAVGEFGPLPARHFDVIGAGVIHVYRMGSGPGVRISEPVYRQLRNDRRGAWRKHQPPATYSFDG